MGLFKQFRFCFPDIIHNLTPLRISLQRKNHESRDTLPAKLLLITLTHFEDVEKTYLFHAHCDF